MGEDEDPEKGHLPLDADGAVPHAGRAVADDKEVDGEALEDQHSGHSPRASSGDDIEALPVQPGGEDGARSKSQSSSLRSRSMSVVPPSKRRGLLGRFTIIPEVERPQEYPNSTKWAITTVIALAGAAAPMGSAIFYPTLPQLSVDFHASTTVTNLAVAMYMLSMSIFPLWWSSFSETVGRRNIYLTSFALNVLWNVLSAISTSIGMLVVMRILGGGAAASVQAVGAGTIADIWESRERGRAMGMFYLGPLMGPLISPIIGGALTQAFGWRSTAWFLVIYGGIIFVLLTFTLPETLKKAKPLVTAAEVPQVTDAKTNVRPQLTRVSTRQSVKKSARSCISILKRCIVDPLRVLAYLRFPAVAITVYYASITFGTLYVLNISVQQTFSRPPYSYSVLTIGLLYIPASVGYLIASLFGGRWSDIIMHREARAANRYDAAGKLIFIPEDRMRENAYLAAAVYPAALLWYGWTVNYHLHWAIASAANFFFGVGSMIIFSISTTMLTEFMPRKSSSGVAINNFVRNIFSCVGGIVASPIIDAIGNGWLFTGLGVITGLSGGVVWAMRRFGPRWRRQMEQAMAE